MYKKRIQMMRTLLVYRRPSGEGLYTLNEIGVPAIINFRELTAAADRVSCILVFTDGSMGNR